MKGCIESVALLTSHEQTTKAVRLHDQYWRRQMSHMSDPLLAISQLKFMEALECLADDKTQLLSNFTGYSE
jgi:hypothetical protein